MSCFPGSTYDLTRHKTRFFPVLVYVGGHAKVSTGGHAKKIHAKYHIKRDSPPKRLLNARVISVVRSRKNKIPPQ